VSIRYSQFALLSVALAAQAILLAGCESSATAENARDFNAHWDLAMPVRDYLYLGDNLPECTDTNANMMAYRRDRSLAICTGTDNGWQTLKIGDATDCNICGAH
jgi:hypothetical protein